ncbi:MAG: ubiquinol-cytochrome c reductase iron-sulfur subunit [Candidatus Aminicenantes bacterium]|nr:ubiquinol-cytochrome c reductase iron-sulfur subunit [Candidatus Aminicenantes bacterium]
MRIDNAYFTRRKFLNSILGGWLGAVAASFISPIVKFVWPPYKEPDEVKLVFADYSGMQPGEVKNFAWGSKPGLIKRAPDGSFIAWVGVCTHLDCNVAWLPDKKQFFCACHDGWYDENGTNVSGPPPKPLRRLESSVEGEDLFVRKPGVGAKT